MKKSDEYLRKEVSMGRHRAQAKKYAKLYAAEMIREFAQQQDNIDLRYQHGVTGDWTEYALEKEAEAFIKNNLTP